MLSACAIPTAEANKAVKFSYFASQLSWKFPQLSKLWIEAYVTFRLAHINVFLTIICLSHRKKIKIKKRKTEPEGEVHNSKETQAWFYMKSVGWKKKKESYALWSVTGFNHRIFPETAFWTEILTGIFKPIQYCCSDSEVVHTKLNWF